MDQEMSTKKIEGYVDQLSVPPHSQELGENIVFQDHKWLSKDLPTTLVIHEGEREPVFTKSEVVEMLREIGQKSISHFTSTEKYLHHIAEVATKHGITL